MKVESNWTKTRYSFICEDEKDKKFLDNMNKYIDELEEENKTLKDNVEFLHSCLDDRDKSIAIMQEENKKLNTIIENTKIEQEADRKHIEELEEENKKLKAELSKYKKQYEHSMGEDNGKLTKGGYASFNEYGELMEEDTLQELRDIGEI